MNKNIRWSKTFIFTLGFIFVFTTTIFGDINTDYHTDTIQQQSDILKMAFEEINIIKKLMAEIKNDQANKARINSDLETLNQHSLVLDMILSELKAMNEMIVMNVNGSANLNYEINCITDKIYNLVFTGSNLKQSGDMYFKVKYDPEYIEVIDLCGITPEPEMNVGEIQAAGVTITSFDHVKGVVRFSVKRTIMSGKSWSGVLSDIKFKAKKDGKTTVNTVIY